MTKTYHFKLLMQAGVAALVLAGGLAQALQIPGIGGPPVCDPNGQYSCAPGTVPPTPTPTPPAGPGTCGPGRGGATCAVPGPAATGVGPGINVGAGNPINVITGNKYQREVDMAALPGVLGLEIVRHYNSVFSSPSHSNGIVGRGWKLSYETDLYAVGTTLQIVQADGTRLTFNRDARNPSLCASANASDGTLRVRAMARGDEYVWRWRDGRELSFNHQGKLVQILVPGGQFVSMQHDSRGMLVRVTDPQGRSLHLHYLEREKARAGDAFRGVQSIDSPVGRFSYGYGSAPPRGATLAKAWLLANLVSVGTPPDGAGTSNSRLYHYENARFPTLLTGISVTTVGGTAATLARRIATYGYDANGQGNLTVRGEPARWQTGADGKLVQPPVLVAGTGVEQVTLDRSRDGLTVISNSLRQQTTYRHAIVGGEYRLLEVRGAGCASCGKTNVRYGYDNAGRLTDSTDLSGDGVPIATIRSEYDKLGRTVKISRIAMLNGKAQTPQLLQRLEYLADTDQAVLIARPSVVPGKEAISRITYNGHGQPLSMTESGWSPALDGKSGATAIERTSTYRYALINGRSLPTRIDGPLPNGKTGSPLDSDVTSIEYDRRSESSGTADAPGARKRYERRLGLIGRIVAPGGQTSQILERDAAGRPTRISTPDGIVLSYTFDPQGHILSRNAGGISEHRSYNALGQLASVTQATGQTVNFAYGADGRISDIFDAQNNRVRISRDSEGRLRARALLNPDGSVAQQTDLSQPVPDPQAPPNLLAASEPANPDGRVADMSEGADGFPEALAGPKHAASRFSYDALHRLTRFVDARGIDSAFGHDDFGRLVRTDSADAGSTIFRYDSADHLVSKTLAYGTAQAATLEYRYDPAGRVIEQSAPEGRTAIRYGPSGRPSAIVFPAGEERYEYDKAARLTVHTRIIDGHRFTTGYDYDQRGQLIRKTLPDGQRLLYRYHGAMHPKAGLLASITRQDLFGQTVLIDELNDADDGYAKQRYRLANGVEFARQLDRDGHITRIGSAGVWEENHARSAGGQLLRRDPVGAAAAGASYDYDSFGRLAGQADDGKLARARGYAYDAGGNLLAQQVGATLTRYRIDPGGNRVLDARSDGRSNAYTYNGAGSVIQIGDTSYTWDSQQRLSKVARAGKPLADYVYNPFGERIKKISYANQKTEVTYFLYDGQQLVAEAQAQAGAISVTRQYVWLDDLGGNRPIALLQARAHGAESLIGKALDVLPDALAHAAQPQRTDVYAIVADHTGAPRALVDAAKRTVWRAQVSGYGAAVIGGDMRVTLNLRGSNQYFDQESGLHYNYRRYFDPANARYLSADPSGLAGGANPYVFGDNNPIDRLDPLGLQTKPAGAVVSWSFADKLKYVIERVADKYPGELGNALQELVSPTALATTATIFTIWGGAQFTPYGWAADIAIAGVGYALVGKSIWDVISGIYSSSSLILNAKCEKDLQDAGDILAKGFGSAVVAAGAGAVGAGAPKVAKLIRLVFKDSALAQKAATAAAITESWYGKFTPGRIRNSDVVNAENLARHPGAYPPWGAQPVTDTWLNPGTKIYMVNLKSATAPGGWATSKQFTNLADARKELALLEEFKHPGSNCCVLQEYTVKAPIPVREGYAGPLTSNKPPYDSYPGGAPQWELLLDRSLDWRNFLNPSPNPISL